MNYILLHVKFEDGLSISVLRNRVTSYKIFKLEAEKFLKTLTFKTPSGGE